MSGGYFYYKQDCIGYIAVDIAEMVKSENFSYSDKTKHILKEMELDLRDLKNKVTRLDLLLSGDISEDDFLADYI